MTITPLQTDHHYSVVDNESLLTLLITHRDYCNSLLFNNILLKLTDKQKGYLTFKAAMLTDKINQLKERIARDKNPT